MNDFDGFDLVSLLPLLLMSIPFTFGFNLIAKRIGRNRVVWTVLSLIPIINYLFWAYGMFIVLFYILDALNDLRDRKQKTDAFN